jgi:hypothetical protein
MPQNEFGRYSRLVKMVIEDPDQQLRARDLRGYDPLRDNDAPPSSASEQVVKISTTSDVETLRAELREQYARELDAERLAIPEVRTLVARYVSRYPSIAMASTPCELANALVRTIGAERP